MASLASDPISILTASHSAIDISLAQSLLVAAIEVKSRAYCPYSRFRVGAAILACPANTSKVTGGTGSSVTGPDPATDKPKLFTGVNVENASYPVGVCAERCAFGTAVAAGFPRIIAVAVSTDIHPPASPCGMCRQFMREFVIGEDVCVIMMGTKADGTSGIEGTIVRRFGELLPMSFGPEDLPSTTNAALLGG